MKTIFHDDEQISGGVDPDWGIEELLAQPGLFYAKDVVPILQLNSLTLKREAKKLETQGRDPYTVMGLRKLWTFWMIRMATFAPYYRAHLQPPFSRLPPGCDARRLWQMEQTYRLKDVCQVIAFKPYQLRNQAHYLANARETMGVYKDPVLGIFLVDMALFRAWVQRTGTVKLPAGLQPKATTPSVSA
ncbi:hypothetical protein [Acanthopleuribacter pedis]|uniref:Uncharacterized protein n=1 Tax=Acanthopleuribacter pedis TaxID=442870 RepID=A0A8J7QAA8_9BACT|nr:hypothetical protein [Acanthopleuribacter pedis]MBO1320349.1 hypothetical protein [Acanthopleuribacter pedis]